MPTRPQWWREAWAMCSISSSCAGVRSAASMSVQVELKRSAASWRSASGGQLANVLVAHDGLLSLEQRLEPLPCDLQVGGPDREPPAVGREQRVPAVRVVLVEHRGDLGQRQLDRPQPPDGGGPLELVGPVQPVPGLGVDRGRPEKALLVVQAQGLRREAGQAGEAANWPGVHDQDGTPCPGGKVKGGGSGGGSPAGRRRRRATRAGRAACRTAGPVDEAKRGHGVRAEQDEPALRRGRRG